MNARSTLATLVSVVLLAALATCGGPHSRRPNLVLVTLDTTRADFCSLYGCADGTTPTLEALAKTSTVFDEAVAPATWTLPSHASLWTGVYPRVHGSISSLSTNGEEYGRPLRRELPTLPRELRAAGYQTAGFIGGPFLHRGLGFSEGFDHYDDRLDSLGLRCDEVNRRALEWLETSREKERPLFLFVNYYDPHRPYDPPKSLHYPFGAGEPACEDSVPKNFDAVTSGRLESAVEVTCARRQYSKEIYAMDRALGILLAELDRRGELRDAVIAVVGDHGEAFGENGVWTHGGPGFLHQRRVPMLISRRGGPRTEPGRVHEPVSTVRLPRTLLALAGLPVPEAWLEPALLPYEPAGLPPLTERYVLAESFFTLSFPGWTYLRVEPRSPRASSHELLFDLAADPGEEHNLLDGGDRADRRAVLADARSAWDQMIRLWGGPVPTPIPVYAPDAESKEKLQRLGYTR